MLSFVSFSVVALLIEKRFAFLKALEGSPTKKSSTSEFYPPPPQKKKPKFSQNTAKKLPDNNKKIVLSFPTGCLDNISTWYFFRSNERLLDDLRWWNLELRWWNFSKIPNFEFGYKKFQILRVHFHLICLCCRLNNGLKFSIIRKLSMLICLQSTLLLLWRFLKTKLKNRDFILRKTRKLSTDEQTFINSFFLLNFKKVFGIRYNLFFLFFCFS